MKRLACAVLILCLIPVCALADDPLYKTSVFFDVLAETLGVPTLPETFEETTKENGNTERIYTLSDGIKVLYELDKNKIVCLSVVCMSADDYIDFLGVCCAGVYSVCETISPVVCGNVLLQFMQLRSGNDVNIEIYNDYVYKVSAIGGGRMAFIFTNGGN